MTRVAAQIETFLTMACSLTNQASAQPDALSPWNKTHDVRE